MDVARPFAQRGGNDQIHQIDDRGFVGHHLDVLEIFPFADFGALRVEVFYHFLDRHLIAGGDLLDDFGGRSLKFLHFQTAQQPDVGDHPLVAGSGGGDVNGSVVDGKRQEAVALGKFGGQRANDFRRHVQPGEAARLPLEIVASRQIASVLNRLYEIILRISD